ncbi:unnamed protein product [Calypogeia fissa]
MKWACLVGLGGGHCGYENCSFFGMLTVVGDIVAILVVRFVVLWYFIKRAVFYVIMVDHRPMLPGDLPSNSKVGAIGALFGKTSTIPIALLWLPVSRGSAILQVMGVPFERAVKYHSWLGYLVVWLVFLRESITRDLVIGVQMWKLITWNTHGTFVAAGVVAGAAGLIMTLTAVERVRRKFLDLFFTAHHLWSSSSSSHDFTVSTG